MAYTLSTDQAEALRQIGAWYRAGDTPYLTLGGYAGTGKTTLIAYLRQALRQNDPDARVAFCAFTGKAARVLAEKLKEQKVAKRHDSVSTIHSLIYNAESDRSGNVRWNLKDRLEFNLIIVDEASMVDEAIWRDLLSFEVPVLAVGDHGQLPPVASSFNLMAEPKLRLERIFRQAEDSPIVELATQARLHGHIAPGEYGSGVRKLDRRAEDTANSVQELLEFWSPDRMVLCGYNKTRNQLNATIRGHAGFDTPLPASGDRVVCLRNNHTAKLFNGLTGTIRYLRPADNDPDGLWYEAEIDLDNEDYSYSGLILREQFGASETIKQAPLAPGGRPGDLFDFGYALTVHKAQGSQAQEVLLFEERFPKMTDEDWRRWLYTGITRAENRLTLVGDARPRYTEEAK